MKNFVYDLLIDKNNFYTHNIVEKSSVNESMPYTHNHEHYEILYVYDSERILIAEKNKYILNKNTIALIPPYTIHRTIASPTASNENCKRYLINFTKDFVSKLSNAMEIDVLSVFQQNTIAVNVSDKEAEFVKYTITKMFEYNNPNNSLDEQMFRMLLCSMLTLFARNVTQKTNNDEKICIDKIIDYITENFDKDITLDILAKNVFVNKYEISRTFRKNTGITFVEYLSRIRIEKAKKLLSDTSLSVTEISYMVGLNGPSNFARVFRKLVGISPVEYRKNKRIS